MLNKHTQQVAFTLWIIGWIVACIMLFTIVLDNKCLPDSPDRFYMGRTSQGACLYQNMNTGEIYND